MQSLMTGAIVAGLCDICSVKALYCPSPTEFAALHSHTAPCMRSSALALSLSWPNEVSLPHVGGEVLCALSLGWPSKQQSTRCVLSSCKCWTVSSLVSCAFLWRGTLSYFTCQDVVELPVSPGEVDGKL